MANPTALIPQTYIPLILPTGTSLAASVITASPNGNAYQFAIQCQDPICSGDPPATATYSYEPQSGPGTYAFAWTAANDPSNSTSYGCNLPTATDAEASCTIAANGITVTNSNYDYALTYLLAPPGVSGLGWPVAVTSGAEKLPASSLTCGASSTACSSDEVVKPSGDGSAPVIGASKTSGPASNVASATSAVGSGASSMAGGATSVAGGASSVAGGASSASATAQATGGAATVAGGVGAAMAVAALVGAVAL